MDALEQVHKRTRNLRILLGLGTLLGALVLCAWPLLPVDDPARYFNFADKRSMGGIPNAFDVLSNLAFLLFGGIGIKKVFESRRRFSSIFFYCGLLIAGAAILTGFGSAFFHWNPTPATLLWDRLPMTVAFSSVLAMVIADRVDEKIGKWILLSLPPLGLLSVIGFSEGWLTLRPYIALQYGSILFIVILVTILPAKAMSNSLVWSAFGLYAVAKVFELADSFVYDITGLISGHTLKHLFAALAVYKVLTFYDVEEK